MQLTPRWLFFFEKWYFDALADDGSFLFGYLAHIHLLGRRTAELVVWYFPLSGAPATRFFHLSGNDLRLAPERDRVHFAQGELDLAGDPCRIEVSLGDLQLRLRYERRDPSWTPGRDGLLLGRGRNRIRWVVPLPCGQVTAEGRIGEATFAYKGHGYVDFVQTDTAPWRIPLRRLLWGRALGPEGCLVWELPVFGPTTERRRVTRGYARVGDEPGRALDRVTCEVEAWQDDPKTGDRFPTTMRLLLAPTSDRPGETTPLSVRVSDTRLLLAETVADLQQFSHPVEQWFYRAATGDPVTYKLLSKVQLGELPPMWAAHELVLWGRGKKR